MGSNEAAQNEAQNQRQNAAQSAAKHTTGHKEHGLKRFPRAAPNAEK